MNRNVFQNAPTSQRAETTNNAGGAAYLPSARGQLAQLALTGTFANTFYVTGEKQLEDVLQLARQVPVEFLAKLACYARESGYMKDTPALLLGVLVTRDPALARRVADRVLTDGKMVKNFVQVMRSGAVGRKSLGSCAKGIVQAWMARRNDDQIFRASVGNQPSLPDVIRLAHPTPAQAPVEMEPGKRGYKTAQKKAEATRNALYGYLLDKKHAKRNLPDLVKQYERFKAGKAKTTPNVPFQLLTHEQLTQKGWIGIARDGSWQMVRQNLNTFARHEVFKDPAATASVAAKLRDPEEIRRAKAFPYQLLAAFLATNPPPPTRSMYSPFGAYAAPPEFEVPAQISEALQDAMEIAVDNVPVVEGVVVICPDVSGSMRSPVTGAQGMPSRPGYRPPSKVRCVDVAGLMASALLRKNSHARVIPFEGDVVNVRLNARDSVMTNAQKLADVGGGSTDCSAPLRLLNHERQHVDLVVFISDNESWARPGRYGSTAMMGEWTKLKQRCPKARMVCIDIQPNPTIQAPDSPDILNVGGFSDTVFDVVADFSRGWFGSANHFAKVVEEVTI